MFGFNRTEQKLKAIRKKIEVPSLPEFENNEIVGRTNVKRHVLRFSACAVVVAVALIGVVIFQGMAGLKTPVQNGTSAQGTAAKNSFTLTAYAASPSSEDNGVTPIIRNINQSTGTTLQPNVNITLPTGKVDKVEAGSNAGAEELDSSGFQFSGNGISSITMTTQKGKLIATDGTKVTPLFQKELQYYQKNGISTEYSLTVSEKDLLNSYFKTGQTVSFSPSGFTAYWEYALSNNETVSDTITVTIKFNDGSTQNKTVTIGESDSGNLTANLS